MLVAALLVAFFVHRLIFLPLRDLESGAKTISSGDLQQQIPVRSGDEFGQLADSFNAMTAALRNSRAELSEWAHTLEQKVQQRTEQLRIAQAEAARGEKLASVGLLASGIAHELNNPLTGVLTFSHLLRQKMADGSQEAEDMDLVIRETKRCAAIIKRLLDFARDKPPEKKFADLNQIIEETVRFVERPAHLNNIDIALDLDPLLPQVWVDPDQMKQVVMNLLVNAQHAIDGEGRIDHQHALAAGAEGSAARRGRRGGGGILDQRYGLRDLQGESEADLRSVLHHQGGRNRHRAGLVRQSWHRRGPWRYDRDRKRGGSGLHLPGRSPARPAVRQAQ